MLREDVTILVIENKDLSKMKDIAFEAWKMKAKGNQIQVEFMEEFGSPDIAYVSFVEERDFSIREIVETWGKVVDERKGVDLTIEYFDVHKDTLEKVDQEKQKGLNEDYVFVRAHL